MIFIMFNKKYMKANKAYSESMGSITSDAVEYFKALPLSGFSTVVEKVKTL